MFRSFASQKERKNAGGSAFLELQYCALPRGTSLKKIVSAKVSAKEAEHWKNDSLYVRADDLELFSREYGNLFDGNLSLFGIGYYSPLRTENLIEKIATTKPIDYEILLTWLVKAKEQNGFYILGL